MSSAHSERIQVLIKEHGLYDLVLDNDPEYTKTFEILYEKFQPQGPGYDWGRLIYQSADGKIATSYVTIWKHIQQVLAFYAADQLFGKRQ